MEEGDSGAPRTSKFEIVKDASRQTLGQAGGPTGIFYLLATTFTGYFIFTALVESDELTGAWENVVAALASFGVASLLLFLFNLVCAPARHWRERANKAETRVAQLEPPPLADRLDNLGSEIREIVREYEAGCPAPGDNLNYVSPDVAGSVKMAGRDNMVTTPNTDPFQVRVMQNFQRERANYDRKYLDQFHGQCGGQALSRLRESVNLGALPEERFSEFEGMMRTDYLGWPTALFRFAEACCIVAAAKLRELG